MKPKWAVIQFPGSNSDLDAYNVFKEIDQIEAVLHWHQQPIAPSNYQVILIPGGFSFGDYLRAGAIAKLSPAIASLEEAIDAGAHCIGICNGFQILLESRILPGALHANQKSRFISTKMNCRITEEVFPWFRKDQVDTVISLPVAHGFGNYQYSNLDQTELKAPIVYENNLNGSKNSVAGVYRTIGEGSAFGLMPHPERASLRGLPYVDGQLFWQNALKM